MNREQKRLMARQGQDPDGEAAPSRKATPPARRPPKRDPFSPGQFLRDVRSELRQVAWPNRSEVINYTTVTAATLVLLIALIFVLNYAFGKGVFWLLST
ncbi:MAG: preprotein translocase subunit SecE [Acidimicrobiales bacterium]